MKFDKLKINRYGKISLVTLLIVGIFFLVPVYGAVTETVSLTATQRTVSSFSFDISPLNSRKYIYPTKVTFDTTGIASEVSPVPPYTVDFPQWDSGYPVNDWNRYVNHQQLSSNYKNYTQISQFPRNFAESSYRNKFLVCGLPVGSVKLLYGISDSKAGFVNCYNSMTSEISSEASFKAFATVISTSRAYCIWTYKPTDSNPVIRMKYFTTSWSAESSIEDSQISEDWGVSGCLMKDGNEEYIVIAYPTSANSINIISFKAGTPSSYTITSGISVSNTISGAQIAISQNPRTGVIYLGWISGSKACYKTGAFQPDSHTKFTFSSSEYDICNVNYSNAAYASIYAGSYNNFETSFTVSDDDSIRNYCICGDHPIITQILPDSGSIPKAKFAAAFQYFENGNYYSGCICCSSFRYIDFYYRLLEYPQKCSWQASKKKLHLEGPPRLNTSVVSQVDFAEMVPANTYARCVNSEFLGGVRPFNNSFNVVGDRAVIASSSHCFFAVGFDKAMNTASYPAELSASVKLIESGTNAQIPLTNIASSSGKFVFKPNTDLKFNSSYVITIASDVIDAIGTQIYKNETLNFKTQLVSTPLDPDGVIKLEAFSDANCTSQILDGSDIKADKKLYLRLNAYDPAFNTIDTTTVNVKRNGSLVTTLNFVQKTASTTYFYGEYQMAAPLNADSNWVFETVDTSKKLNLKVTYPVLSPSSPASGAIGLEPASISRIEVSSSEELDSSSLTTTNVALWQQSTKVNATVTYDNANRKILITPSAALSSEKNYLVTVSNILDKAGNKQLVPLSYYFSTRDNTAPTITQCYPANGATNVTIDTKPRIVFSEEILSSTINSSNIVVTCNGSAANYTLSNSGNSIIIDVTQGLKTQSSYRVEVKTGVTDFSGNHLASVYTYTFTTQPAHTAPSDILSLTLYRDETMLNTFGSSEKVNANTRVYFKLNAVDGATQTLDIATISLSLNGAAVRNIILNETASNSGGLFTGSYDLSGLNLYAYPSTYPAADINAILFASTQKNTVQAELRTLFPQLANSSVSSVGGNVSVPNATNVYVNSPITLTFSGELDEASVTNTSLTLASGSTSIAYTKTLSADKKTITMTPSANLPFASTITLKAVYGSSGIKDITGNPIKGPLNISFKTQGTNTPPSVITEMSLYSDPSMSAVYKYADNSDFYKNGIIYIEVKGTDAAPNTIDRTSVTLTGGANVVLTETGAATGIYRGSYQCTGLADGAFTVTSDVTPAVTKTLVLTTPSITAVVPANNATNVSNAQVIKLTFSEPLSAATVIASNIRLVKKANSENVAATLYYTDGSNEVTLRPDSVLDFSTEYQIIVSNVTDAAGNVAADSSYSFTTQNSATPPTSVTSLKVYSDTSYSVLLASGTSVTPGSSIAVSVEAVDASPTTADYIIVCIKDYTNNQSKNISLPETGVNTGVFRGTAELYEIENSYLEIYAQVDNTKAIGLKTDFYPAYASFAPASASTGLYLDNEIEITANKNIDAATLSKTAVILESNSGNIDYDLIRPANNKIIVSITRAEPGDNLTLTLTSALKDTSALSFPFTVLSFKLRDKGVNTFKVFKDAVYSNEIPNRSDVEANQEIYCEINGVDLTQNGLTDQMNVTFTDGENPGNALLTEYAAGKYRGSVIVPNSYGKTLKIQPEGFDNKALSLNILEPFVLKDFYPASASIGIPADAWPSWTFSRAIPESELVASKFSVYKVSSNSRVNGTLSLSPTGKQVRFKPDSVFDILTLYEMRLSSEVKDTYGNKLGTSLNTRFTTQPPPLPPTNLASFANYSDESYNATLSAILSNSNLYLQMVAEDPSFSTYEAASVRLDSDDGTYDGVVLTLVETNPPSGIFRIVYPVNLPAGTKITLTPQVDDSFGIVVTVRDKPRLLALNPASGTANLYLDTKLEMTFSSELDTELFASSVVIKNSKKKVIPFECEFSNNDKKVVITAKELFDQNENYSISANNLKNKNGQLIDSFTYKVTTKKESMAALELYTGLAPCDGQKVSETKEIVRGILGIIASTTDMLKYSEESRIVRLSDASHSVDININETALNSNIYVASTTIDSSFSSPMTAELLFADKAVLNFDIASQTYLVEVSPAENEETTENTLVKAVYSRKVYIESAKNAVKIGSEESEVSCKLLNNDVDDVELTWRPEKSLVDGNKHILSISGLLDYLGQSISNHNHEFLTGGNHGISLYSDYSFTNKITETEISLSEIYVEVIGFNTAGLDENNIYLELIRGTDASNTQKLKLQPVGDSKKVYRCALKLADTKTDLPAYSLGLYPGEWVRLSSPLLTTSEVIFYYRYSAGEEPRTINSIKFFSDKNYVRRAEGDISNPSLYIEVDAEDLNWLTQDITKVRVTSDDDRTGFVVDLLENGTHSSSFRGLVKISEKASDAANNILKVSFGKKITVVSETDGSVRASIRYFPKAEIINFSAYPSPAKGNHINFRYFLNFPTGIKITIYDVAGHKIDSIEMDGREGENTYRWNFPRRMANGVYIYRVKSLGTGAFYTYAKMVKGKFAVLR